MTIDASKLEEWKRLHEAQARGEMPFMEYGEALYRYRVVPTLIAEVERLTDELALARLDQQPLFSLRTAVDDVAKPGESRAATVRRLAEDGDRLRSLLREVEWSGRVWELDEDYACCLFCGGFQRPCAPQRQTNAAIGHVTGCRLAAAIKEG